MLERVRRALKPATSQVVDLVIALLLFFPESQVLLEKLDDALSIAEVVLLELVNLVESLLESVVGKFACLGVVLQHFVVENGEVEGQAKFDGVAGGQIDAVSLFVGLLSLALDLLKFGVLRVLGNVAVVVADHLDEEGFRFVRAGAGEDAGVDHVDDLLAVSHELSFNLALVLEKRGIELGVLGVLFDGGDCAASGAFARDEVLESDGKQVALIGVDGATLGLKDFVEEVDHVLKALGLLGNSGEENLFFNVVGHCVGGGETSGI